MDSLCVPRFDSPSVFTRLLGGPDNGHWRIRPRDGREVGRSYRAGSFVLDTEWAAPSGTATTTDFLTMDHGVRGDHAVSTVRRVVCTGGSLEVEADLVIRFDYGRVVPWVRRRADAGGDTVLYAIAGPDSLTLRRPGMRAHYDTDAVDAALLQVSQTGFVAADSDLVLATVALIEAELLDPDRFVRRYLTDGSDGLVGSEGAVLMRTFWLVEQYASSGRRDEATALMDRLLDIRSDLGLLAEEYDPARGCLLGNYPQAFSHLGLIRASEALGR